MAMTQHERVQLERLQRENEALKGPKQPEPEKVTYREMAEVIANANRMAENYILSMLEQHGHKANELISGFRDQFDRTITNYLNRVR